ncbi:MAG TPA: hypothetical protein VHP33_38190 [Polyangiaceae bacterium]|nr:hypothetical protein [Polyangiaceae bacterium]
MKAKSTLNWGRLLLSALVLPGCYTTTVTSGKPAAPATVAYDEKWHSGVVYGIAELSGPHDLEKICPQGWSEIKTETSFLNGFVDAATWGFYNPQNITVRCALPTPPIAAFVAATPATATPATATPAPSDLPAPPAPPSGAAQPPPTP